VYAVRTCLAVLTAWLVASACGNLTSGGFGDLEVLVATDSVPSLRAEQATQSVVPVPLRQARTQSQIEGTLTMRIQVFAFLAPSTLGRFVLRGDAAAGEWIEVTDGVREIVLSLSETGAGILARKELPAGTYTAVRTVFLHVEAQVEGGLVVDGVPIRGPVRVDLGGDRRLVVETPIELNIADGGEARINVNLHTQRWIRLLNAQRQVRSQDFAGEVRIGRQP
jgi:hypothetical protein